MTLDELEAVFKKLAEYAKSEKAKEYYMKNHSLYLVILAIGNLSEVALKMITEWTRHDQW